MYNYSLKTAIPTESISKGLYYENDLYFSSNTFIYKYNQNVYTIVGITKNNIRGFCVKNKKIYCFTDDSFIIIYKNKIIASMKKVCNCILVNDKFIIMALGNMIEIWNIPTEYKLNMFDLQDRNFIHFGEIKCMTFYKENRVITGSIDCTVKVYSITNKKVQKVCSTRSSIVGIECIDDEIYVCCEEGQIYIVNEIEGNFKIVNVVYKNTTLLSSSSSKGLLAICLYEDKKCKVEVLKNCENLYGLELENYTTQIDLSDFNIAMRGNDFVGIYNLETDMFLLELVLPKIVSMDINRENIVVGCSDKKIRVYDDNRCIKVLSDEKNTFPLHKVFFINNSVLSLSIDGYVSIFDLRNGVCYRSFRIPVKVSSSEVCNDGMLLFVADLETYKIKVVDLQRSKEIDILEGHESAIKNMKCYKNFLFSLSLDNELRKWNILTSESESLNLEKSVSALNVRNNKIYLSFIDEINVYNLNFEYENSISYKIKSRKRSEVYIQSKPAEHLDISLDGRHIFYGGESNRITISDLKTGEKIGTLKVSRNVSWENYKDKLFNEKKENFDKTKIIEVFNIMHSKNQIKLYVQSRETVMIYQKAIRKFVPLNLDIETTPQAIKAYIKNGKYINGLVGSLKINQNDIIIYSIINIPEDVIEFVVQYVPEEYIDTLRENITKITEKRYKVTLMFKWLRFILYHHGASKLVEQLTMVQKVGEEVYKISRENMQILDIIKNKY